MSAKHGTAIRKSLSEKPTLKKRTKAKSVTLLAILREEKRSKLTGGIYHRLQVDMAYNSNHMEGSRLTHEQTCYIYEIKTIAFSGEAVRLDDVQETVNHFRCVDAVLDHGKRPLSEAYILRLHRILKQNTSDAEKDWFAVGAYKKSPNEVGGRATTKPEEVNHAMKVLLQAYNQAKRKMLEEILDFHARFERIHPFQDGNGRVGRLILLSECLRNDIVPFIITDGLKFYYYRGLAQWEKEGGYLLDTCLKAQDDFKEVLKYFRIGYDSTLSE